MKQDAAIWVRVRRRTRDVESRVILVFARQPARAGEASAHVAVFVRLHRPLPGPPREWLPHVVSIARPVAERSFATSTPFIELLVARERELLAAASAQTAVPRWQPSFFDRRAERIVDAVRSDMNRKVEAHETRILELTSSHAEPIVEPILAIWVE